MKLPSNYLLGILIGVRVITSTQASDNLSRMFANFVFSFTRRESSATDTTQVFEYGSDLSGWTSLNITPPTAGQVALGVPAGGLQTVTISIPKALAGLGGKLFGRLRVFQP